MDERLDEVDDGDESIDEYPEPPNERWWDTGEPW